MGLEQAGIPLINLASRLQEEPGIRISFETEMPESASPSSPPSRLTIASGRSAHGSVVRVQRIDLADLLLELADLREQPAMGVS